MEQSQNIDGIINSVSHIFRLKQGPIFIIEFQTQTGLCYIVIRRRCHLLWHDNLKPGLLIRITKLKKACLYKEYNNPVYETCRASSFFKLEVELYPNLHRPEDRNKERLISFEGTITAVIDGELGIFKVDQNLTLIISLILDLTAKLYNKDTSYYGEERICLRVGDKITLYNAHYLNKNGQTFFVACGRTLLQVKRKMKPNYKCQDSNNVIIHCLHTFNLGKEFLDWLRSLKNVLSSFNLKNSDSEGFNERAFYRKFVLENKKLQQQIRARSLIKEFLLHDSNCFLSQEFVAPFELVRVKDLKFKLGEEVPTNIEDSPHSTPLWRYSVSSNEGKSLILLGKLETDDGYVKIKDDCSTLDLAFMRQGNSEVFYPIGTVCITQFNLIHEFFMEKSNILHKEYLLVKDEIAGVGFKPTLEGGQDDVSVQLEVIVKSGLSFSPNRQSGKTNPFFFVLCRISKYGSYGSLWTSNKSLIIFDRDYAKLFPLLSERSLISGTIPFNLVSASDFKKTKAIAWFPLLQRYFGTNEVVCIPESFVVRDISHAKNSSICTTFISNFEYKTLQGWVKKRIMIESKHRQEKLPSQMVNAHIGIPEGKTICLLIQEDSVESTTNTWWVYFDFSWNSVSRNIVPLYPLGMLLNVKVALTWLELHDTENLRYLRSTTLTEVIVLSYTGVVKEAPKTICSRHLPLRKVKTMLGGSLVKIRCTISTVMKVVFRVNCPSCRNVMVDGRCSYVGCHSKEMGAVASYAQVIVEDGTGSASVFINDSEMLRILLNVRKEAWDAIHRHCSFLTETGELNYSIFKNNRLSLGHILDAHCRSSYILRPVIILARIFQKNSYSRNKDLLELFCLELKNFRPLVD